MSVIKALAERHSCRAFLDKAVPKTLIESLLESAAKSPSGANMQPWQVAVVTGNTKQQLQDRMLEAFSKGVRGSMDYTYYPNNWIEPFDYRRKACGAQLYDSLGIERSDKQRRLDQWAANYRAFDAPVMLLFFLDGSLETGSYIDYGMYLQSLMLAAQEQGLATCPQAALADYPDIIVWHGYEREAIPLLRAGLLAHQDAWDCVWMPNVAGWTGAVERSQKLLSDSSFHIHSRPCDFACVSLPRSHEEIH